MTNLVAKLLPFWGRGIIIITVTCTITITITVTNFFFLLFLTKKFGGKIITIMG